MWNVAPERDPGWEPETRVRVQSELPIKLGALRLTSSPAPGLLLTYEMGILKLDIPDNFTITINHGIGVRHCKSVCQSSR